MNTEPKPMPFKDQGHLDGHGDPTSSMVLQALTQSPVAEKIVDYYCLLKDKAARNPNVALDEHAKEVRQIADVVIDELLRECLLERDAFLLATAAFYRDHGLTFKTGDESYCPGPFREEEIEGMRITLGLAKSTEKPYDEVWRNYSEQTKRKYAEAVPAEETPA